MVRRSRRLSAWLGVVPGPPVEVDVRFDVFPGFIRDAATRPARKARSPRLLAFERERQAGDDEGREKDRQNTLSGASEGDDLALGGVEGLGSA